VILATYLPIFRAHELRIFQENVEMLRPDQVGLYNMYDRDSCFWVDQPPPERDPELGKNAAWQTPIHREAVRRALEKV
jgi:hypothetical protein